MQQDDEQDIKRQFAQLQAEMKRVMAERPPPSMSPPSMSPPSISPGALPGTPPGTPPEAAHPADPPADFQRIEEGLDALRRGADLSSAHAALAADQPVSAETLAVLRTWIDGGADKLSRAVQRNREAIDDIAIRLDELQHRRPSRWPVPLAIVLGALTISAAVFVSAPGGTEWVDPGVLPQPRPSADNAPPPAAEPPASASPGIVAAAPPPAIAPPAAPAPQAAQPPVPAAVAVTEPAAPVAAPPSAPAPPAASAPQVTDIPAPTATAAVETRALAPPAAASPAAPAAASPAAPVPPPAPALAVAAPIARGQIVLRAKSDTWIEVRNRQGSVLVTRLLHDGDSWTVPDQAGLFLSTGNAGGLELLVDGTPAPPLGGMGGVRRDVPLDAVLVRAGHYAPDPTARSKPLTANR